MNRLSMTTTTQLEAECPPITRESTGNRKRNNATVSLSNLRVDFQQSLTGKRLASFVCTQKVLSPVALEVGVIDWADLRLGKWHLGSQSETNGQTNPSYRGYFLLELFAEVLL